METISSIETFTSLYDDMVLKNSYCEKSILKDFQRERYSYLFDHQSRSMS